MKRRLAIRSALGFAMLAFAACNVQSRSAPAYVARNGGDARHGAQLIREYSCGACHTIPGISGADGTVAPPLDFFSRRSFIAGVVANTPANLEQWIADPQSIEPKTAMPKLGLDTAEARDVAAYLLTLR